MMTRRQAIVSSICAPLLGAESKESRLEIIAEDTCLSIESAAGYNLCRTPAIQRHSVLVVAAACRFRQRTMERIRLHLRRASLVVIESGASFSSLEELRDHATLLNRHFGICVGERHTQPARYIQFTWPARALVRNFGPVLRVNGSEDEVVARSSEVPVAVRRGNLVFLGAMLGPHLFAGDREAHELYRALLVRCGERSFAGTSTTA